MESIIDKIEKAIKMLNKAVPKEKRCFIELGTYLYKEIIDNKERYGYRKFRNKEYIFVNGKEAQIILQKPLPEGVILEIKEDKE